MPARPAFVIGVLASCGLTVSLMQTLVVPLLPRFPQLLATSTATVAWLVTATLVAGAVCAPLLGRLGDMYGKRRMLLVALVLITVGSALGALAPGVELLIVARVLQGAALGVIPLGISIMRDVLPAERVGSGIALMSSSLGIGGAIGLPLTGLVAEHASWRWLFAGAAVLGGLQLLLVARVLDESPIRSGGRFDLLGALGLGSALVCLLLAVSRGSEWGWGGARVIGLLIAAAVLFAVWGRWELRTSSPLVDLRVSARPAVLWTNVASVLIGFAMFAGFLVTTQILQASTATGYGFGLSLLAAGLVMLPIGGAMTIFSPVSARLSRRFSARFTLLAGIAGAGRRQRLAGHPARLDPDDHAGLDGDRDRRGAGLLGHSADHHERGAGVRDRRGEQPEHPDADARHQLVQRGVRGRGHRPGDRGRGPRATRGQRLHRGLPGRGRGRPGRLVITALNRTRPNRPGPAQPATGRVSRHELVACAQSRPAPSKSRASASAVRPPRFSSTPSQRTGPDAAPRPRRNFTERSKLV